MNGNVSKVLVLEGLCCANCAAKIESQVKDLSGVRTASIDFISRRLTIEAEDKGNLNGIVASATAIVKKIEPHVVVVEEKRGSAVAHDEHENHNHGEHVIEKKELLTLMAGCVLFAAAFLLKSGGWVQLALFAVAYLVIGGDVLLQSMRNIIRGQVFDENFLMSIATIGAFIVGEYPEGVSVMLFYKLGELFQDMAVNRSRKSISSLMNIRPDYANLKEGDDIRKVSPEEVHIGSFIIVKPGEKVPLDGKVFEGSSAVDTSALTGESVPKDVGVGDSVLAGFVNQSGLLYVQVTKEFGESTVAKILDLVQNASSKKAATEKFITRFARYYTPAVVFSAIALAVIPPVINGQGNFAEWLYRALVFLVVSCPCALVISIPLSFFGGIGGASHRGILIKGSSYLEALNNVETVAFDKTGTLTKGIFKVTKVNVEEGFTEGQLLKIAALAESYSNHPIAQSIKTEYERSVKEAEADNTDVENYKELPGLGVAARLSGMNIAVGNSRMMDKIQVPYKAVEEIGTAVYIAVDKKFAGSIVISDIIKEDSAAAVKALKAIGVDHVAMLTGDSAKIAENIGRQLGIDEIYAELLPDQKVERIEALEARKQKGGKLVFVGDGINDAPVLARADIGIAMGGLGSDAAIEAADIVIMNDEPSKIAEAIKIARKTRTIVWQNIIFALGVKAVVLVLGAIGFATMWEAVFADVGVALIAVINAMRAMKVE